MATYTVLTFLAIKALLDSYVCMWMIMHGVRWRFLSLSLTQGSLREALRRRGAAISRGRVTVLLSSLTPILVCYWAKWNTQTTNLMCFGLTHLVTGGFDLLQYCFLTALYRGVPLCCDFCWCLAIYILIGEVKHIFMCFPFMLRYD